MFDWNGPSRVVAIILPLALLAGCSSLSGDDAGEETRLVVGTTSAPTSLDPAAAWDGSWELYRNIYQTLMTVPNAGSPPEPDAATTCGFADSGRKVYRCVLRKGLKFSSGNPLNARAVKHSFDRTRSLKAKPGPAPLLSSLKSVEAQGSRTVIFRLRKPDATFPFVLSTPAASLVDPADYPSSSLRRGKRATGSGPYILEDYVPDEKAVLAKNPQYKGAAKIKNDAVTIRYYGHSSRMVRDLKSGRIDLTYRGLTPRQITALQDAGTAGEDAVELTEMTGTEIHYLVFNSKDPQARRPAVRAAVAQLIDRKTLVRNVYKRTADPLYSMVPTGVAGHTNAYLDRYGDPSGSKARRTLTAAGIHEKVRFTLWYSDDRYGEASAREFDEIKRQLNDSGLFEVTVKGRPWSAFQKGYLKGEYPVFGRGWSADFPDADNYITPFVGKENAMGAPYPNRRLTEELLPRSRRQSDRGAAGRSFAAAQRQMAKDAQLLPLWQGKVYIASQKDVAGVEWAVDASVIMRMWELYKKSSW
ncbi:MULTISPECIES: ABC transporter substrate-binding protein [unclassified Streptomyces]|uniref:ABC transporter substrate-binding protein n=1 Tax=unclassified Streptomyces TaxID=2593676 RepID=UPI002DD9C1E0|nr:MULTISPECIES: ABC transporter substrate-binding protein [unclassified Streptomyces]WSB81138.1 ABC transporter substrate-binding protein [Streptomyces sp. NBC_01775]WSS10653.1 ABC transporter substrate-binding protein [Streptomyces sp. NBC_01186]WSS39347.1 ABC transporter substrate-binding protein [Streptomyces sp. NBC_01187]